MVSAAHSMLCPSRVNCKQKIIKLILKVNILIHSSHQNDDDDDDDDGGDDDGEESDTSEYGDYDEDYDYDDESYNYETMDDNIGYGDSSGINVVENNADANTGDTGNGNNKGDTESDGNVDFNDGDTDNVANTEFNRQKRSTKGSKRYIALTRK